MTDHCPHRSAVPYGTEDRVARRVLTLERLAGQLQKLERTSHPVRDSSGTVSSGLEILDRLLPDAGFRSGTLIEWIAEKGSADQLALLAARSALGEDRVLIVIDDEESLYPPAAAALGIDLQRLILVRPGKVARRGAGAETKKRPAAASVETASVETAGVKTASVKTASVKTASVETLWALEQALASRGVAVTFCRLEKLSARVFRRLQLSAERGGGLGFLIRPPTARGEPSWSDVRFGVEAMREGDSSSARRWRVEVLRCRRGAAGERFALLEYDDATNTVRPIAPVSPAVSPRRARA
jgi:protein ImuA